MKTVAVVLCFIVAGCSVARKPGDACDPEMAGTASLPLPDSGTCPSRQVAAQLVRPVNSDYQIVSVDSDGMLVQVPARLVCCYGIVGGDFPQSCYARDEADGATPVCDDAGAALQDLSAVGPDAGVVSGPLAMTTAAMAECTYAVTEVWPSSCSSGLPLHRPITILHDEAPRNVQSRP